MKGRKYLIGDIVVSETVNLGNLVYDLVEKGTTDVLVGPNKRVRVSVEVCSE